LGDRPNFISDIEQANRDMWPGISVYPLTEEIRVQLENDAPRKGVYVQEVKPGSPPEKAGLESLDVITGINGVSVENVVDFFEVMNDTESRAYEMNVVRDGSELVIGVEYR
jgi:S1-C subfamily serine protease